MPVEPSKYVGSRMAESRNYLPMTHRRWRSAFVIMPAGTAVMTSLGQFRLDEHHITTEPVKEGPGGTRSSSAWRLLTLLLASRVLSSPLTNRRAPCSDRVGDALALSEGPPRCRNSTAVPRRRLTSGAQRPQWTYRPHPADRVGKGSVSYFFFLLLRSASEQGRPQPRRSRTVTVTRLYPTRASPRTPCVAEPSA